MPQSAPQSAFRSRLAKLTTAVKAFPMIIGLALATLQPSALHAQSGDSSGLPILEQAIAASGGRTAWDTLKDFRAAGIMSLYSGGTVSQSGRADLAGKGLRKFRLSASIGDQDRKWLWNNGMGRLDLGNGKPSVIGRHNLVSLEGFNLPILKVIGLCDGPSRSVALVGMEDVAGVPAYRVRITRKASSRADELALGRSEFQLDFLIRQKTFDIMAIEDTIYPNNQPRDAFQHRVTYSDFRTVAGLQIPFKITEQISGQVTWGLALDSFAVNSGVADSEFLPN